jgi:hypothetical protein
MIFLRKNSVSVNETANLFFNAVAVMPAPIPPLSPEREGSASYLPALHVEKVPERLVNTAKKRRNKKDICASISIGSN